MITEFNIFLEKHKITVKKVYYKKVKKLMREMVSNLIKVYAINKYYNV